MLRQFANSNGISHLSNGAVFSPSTVVARMVHGFETFRRLINEPLR